MCLISMKIISRIIFVEMYYFFVPATPRIFGSKVLNVPIHNNAISTVKGE
jgi:hypothetical protein